VPWREAVEHRELTAEYSATATFTFGECLAYLAASGDMDKSVKLLKWRRWLLDYDPRASVAARLMLRVLGVGEGARLEEVEDVFKTELSRELRPALLMLTGRMQKDEALEERGYAKDCVDAVASTAGDQEAADSPKLEMENKSPETFPLLEVTDDKTLMETLASTSSVALFVFISLAAVKGTAGAVKQYSLPGSRVYRWTVVQPLFRAIYEKCGDLSNEECRSALLKLYYYHY
jgi:hypothetical protein